MKRDGEANFSQRIVALLSKQYCDYLQALIKFVSKTSLLTQRGPDVPGYIKKLKSKDLFSVQEHFDNFHGMIIQMFENKDFCKKARLFQNFVYMLFLDLIKVYNIYYILITEVLDRYKKTLTLQEMEKAFVMYKTFIQFNEIVKREAQNIPLVFGFVFKPPNYYIPDAKLEKTLEKILD